MVDFLFPNSSRKSTFEDLEKEFDLSVFDEVFNLIKSGPQLLFVSGKAGTGKSTLIECIRQKYNGSANVVLS